jgi:hypothetical protein
VRSLGGARRVEMIEGSVEEVEGLYLVQHRLHLLIC